jgi:phosphoenolpyruvate carboxykinase (ATP)
LDNIKESLLKIDIKNPIQIIHNPSYNELEIEEGSNQLEGLEVSYPTQFNCNNVLTGKFTGRSPKDKYIVKDEITEDKIWWDSKAYPNDNKPISNLIWNELKRISTNQLSNKKIFVLDMFCGANIDTRLRIRFVTEVAWQAHFVKNMFLEPIEDEIKNFEPDFHVLNSSKAINTKWEKHKLNSENFICFNFSEKMQIIGGSWYGGEMKKGIFSLMNFLLPQKNIASMHCSSNSNQQGKNSSIFFGLSGTGKTTLSNDSERYLVGDDEHGWDDQGVFNFEGGCYAKTSNLSFRSEPMIYKAIKKNALLENIVIDEDGNADFNNTSITENGRVSYSMEHIKKRVGGSLTAEHPKNIIFLSADATGVLPPLSNLTIEQAMYYYLSGYTSKAIGTEIGLNETQATFSSCFGAAFFNAASNTVCEGF